MGHVRKMDIDYVEVGRRIRETRKLRGLTIEALSEQVGLATDSLRHIEIAASYPRLQTLYRISASLQVSMDYIAGQTPTLTDSIVQDRGLSAAQQSILREVIDSIVPIIAKHI